MNPKVSIQLMGGIANNLFQIATAYAYTLRHNKKLVLLKEKIGTTHGSLETYEHNILSKVNFIDKSEFLKIPFTQYQEPTFNYSEIPFVEGDVYLKGYFQSEKHFKDFKKEISELFSCHKDYRESIIEKYKNLLKHNTCSIHVRRGDYVSLSHIHPPQSINYYMKAVRQMPEDSVFIIVSDDIEWCRNNFPPIEEKFVFIENNPDYEDLLLMSLCKNNIIANSSFSWWGSWLNQNTEKKVIVPSKWFGSSINHDTKDLYCEGWIKI